MRKGKIDTLAFYTQRDTGESGMSVKSLANGCGVAQQSLLELLKEKNLNFFLEGTGKQSDFMDNTLNIKGNMGTGKPKNFYLIKTDEIHVILDVYCERIIHYYAYESRYKKTKAKGLHTAFAQHGTRDFIQDKTNYQPHLASRHDTSTILTVDQQLKKEVEELKLRLVEKDNTISQLNEEVKVLKFKPNKEKTYQNLVHSMFGGEREFYIGGVYPGRVDIVTKNMIIEVKRTDEFEQGFGQLRRYCAKLSSTEHEHKLCTLFLYGDISREERDVLQKIAADTNIQLIFYQDIKHHIDQDELELLQQSA
ncbi:hypothetical protein TI05_15495 [Achromatium sp. WMS3]|nr:hypothetical protein TI05_15495 [Achromatium sp. WMS3]